MQALKHFLLIKSKCEFLYHPLFEKLKTRVTSRCLSIPLTGRGSSGIKIQWLMQRVYNQVSLSVVAHVLFMSVVT